MKKLILSFAAVVLFYSVIFYESSFAAAPVYSYKYDANNRLLSVSKDGEVLLTYIYDNNGNLVHVIKAKPVNDQVNNLTISLIEHREKWTNEIWYSVMLKWTNEGKPDKYNIYCNGTLLGSVTTISFETKSLGSGTYKFNVVPVRNGVEGARSSEVTITVPDVSTGGGVDL